MQTPQFLAIPEILHSLNCADTAMLFRERLLEDGDTLRKLSHSIRRGVVDFVHLSECHLARLKTDVS